MCISERGFQAPSVTPRNRSRIKTTLVTQSIVKPRRVELVDGKLKSKKRPPK